MWKPGPTARIVSGAEDGVSLTHFLAEAGKGEVSANAIRRALDQGVCRVNGMVESFRSRKLKRGDVVEFFLPASHQRNHDFSTDRVLLADDDVLVYDKPAGLPVTPDDAGKKWNLISLLREKFAGLIIPVHRLDADTSGLILVARNEKAARRLETAFRDHAVKKTYLALVRGHPRDKGEFRSYLVKMAESRGIERWRSGRGRDAREAITAWTVEERLGAFASLVTVEPRTGRHHQIRLHFSEMGHPIYGDRIYGDRQDPIHVTRHLLHAHRIVFRHPGSGAETVLTSVFPPDFTEAMRLLRRV